MVHHRDTKDTKIGYREKTIGFGTLSFLRRGLVGPDKRVTSNLVVLCVFVMKISLCSLCLCGEIIRLRSERLGLVRAVTRSR